MKVSDKRIAELIVQEAGNLSAVARIVKLTPQAVSYRVRESEELQEALEAGLMELEGEAHNVLREALGRQERVQVYQNGSAVGVELLDEPDKIAVDTAKWGLARLNKGRWSERQEVTGADGGAVNVELTWPTLGPDDA